MTNDSSQAYLDKVKWTGDGLVPVIAEDYRTNETLMVAWMNREALALTVKEQRAIYWSRSRQTLWRKGEQSGHIQLIKEIRIDCDNDVIALKVEQLGDIACHTGRRSCFYQKLSKDAQWEIVDDVIKDPKEIYSPS